MKNTSRFFSFQWIGTMLMLVGLLTYSGCSEDDSNETIPAPTVTTTTSTLSVEAGSELSITVALAAPAGLKELQVTNSLSADGNASESYTADQTTASYTYTFTPPVTTAADSEFTLTFVATDQQDRTSESLVVTVTVTAPTATDPPTLAVAGEATATGERSGNAEFTLTLTAPAGLKELAVTVDGQAADPVSLDGVNVGEYMYTFAVPDTAFTGDTYAVQVALTDQQDRSSDPVDLTVTVIESDDLLITEIDVNGTTVKRLRGDFEEDMTLDDGPYLIYGAVDVDAGVTLTIVAGQTFYGQPGSDADGIMGNMEVDAGALINAQGTATSPIIFTSLNELTGTASAPGDWGGIEINGIKDEPDAGIVFAYVQINYAGGFIEFTGDAQDEYRGYEALDLKEIGSEADIHHVQVYAGADEGIRIDGGTVNVRYLVAGNCLDSDINWDEWGGYGQFWLVVGQQNDKGTEGRGNRGIDGNDGLNPQLANLSVIGPGADTELDAQALRVDDDPVFRIYNGLFAEWPDDGIEIEQEGSTFTADLATSQGVIAYSYLWNNAGGGEENWKDEGSFFDPATNAVFANVVDAPIGGISPNSWLPTATQATDFDPATINEWFEAAAYVGAFTPDNDWTAGWTSNLPE
ncbi:hypothetical protein [Tunicatimonas pelagia]|uniref:hypothetical protein n=1 Tax=Tunicatimonas pelagia TaxID=931531 RepID=UPI00266678AC|nr:hypothetical protein [Tunicatimonas pelagia]WKN42105.1 hypothetical protein P0M28_24005 [Tunicatimonas pelagia]